MNTIENELNSLAYHGRGIIIGKSGNNAVIAYFIMGAARTAATAFLLRTAREYARRLLTRAK